MEFVEVIKYIIIAALAIAVLAIIAKHIHVVKQSHAYVIERLGAFRAVWGVGFHILTPFIDRIAKKVSLKEQVLVSVVSVVVSVTAGATFSAETSSFTVSAPGTTFVLSCKRAALPESSLR